MKKPNPNIYRLLIFLALLPFITSSCVTQKQIKYLQKVQKLDTTSLFNIKQAADYKIQPNDNLYIHVYSMDEKTNQLFTRMSSTNSSNTYYDAGIYFEGYTVSNEGNIDFPIIGKVYVKELTIEQARALFQQLVDEYLKETVVVVKMAQFNITILGEVKVPGTIKVYQDKINLFEAISRVGDITDFGDRKKVVL
ncbi:MAG: polysaccharide biosynthesis/export family protein, partial [Bacteroidota bacterium]